MIARLFDFVRGLISLALLLLLLVGIPALLLLIVGYPLPTETPSIDLIRSHLESGDIPDEFIIKALAVMVWFVWAQLAVAVLTETFATLRGRVARRAPVLPGMQLMAGKLVASSVLIISAFLPSRAATAAPIHPIDASEMAIDASIGAPPSLGVSGQFGELSRNGLTGLASGPVGIDGGAAASVETASGWYETKSGDSWWDMAERLLGDGMRWSELRDLNSGKTMLTGDVISGDTEEVKGGWQLDVPSGARADLLVQSPIGAPDIPTDAAPVEVEVRGEQFAAAVAAEQSDSTSTEVAEDAEVSEDAEAAPAEEAGREIPASSPLIEAIKPFALVYEGPTGATPVGDHVPYQVVAGDNLWDIAERHLGDPFRWPEIFENSNDLTQTFGRTISDPNLIWPDSVVLLPGDATGVPPADPELVAEVVGPISASSEQGSAELPLVPEKDLGGALRPQDLEAATEAAEANLPDGVGPDGPDGSSDPDGGLEEGAESSEERSGLAGALSRPAGAAFGAGGLLLATGLLGLLQRARRLRQSEAGPRTIPSPPPIELVDIETVLRNSADQQRSLSVHQIIASLADRTIVPGEPVAAPEVIRIGADRAEVIQHGEDPDLPSPWLAATNTTVETLRGKSLAVLPAEFFPEDLSTAPDTEHAAPTCVSVGGGLLLNLEAVGVIAVDGSVEASAGLIRSMVHELATGPARRTLDIRVSDRLPGATLHDHVRCGPLDALVAELAPWFEDVDLGMTAAGGFSSYALRAAGQGRSIPDPKVIFADVDDVAGLAPLIERARRQTMPLAVVITGDLTNQPVQPAVTVAIDGGTTTLEPYGIAAATQHLETDLILSAEALITHARRAPMVHRDDDQATILPHADHPTDPAQVATEETPEHEIATEQPADKHEVTDQADETDTGILIRVLGPVEFDGGPDDLSEPERSLLTFLALVGPSTTEQVHDAVWPDEDVPQDRVDSTLASLRERLGLLLPDAADGRHRVRSIITDLGSARRWLHQAAAMSGERSRNLTELALAEVRGIPFEGVEPRYWQWVEDHKMAVSTQASSMLIDACFDLCDGAYADGNLQLASWACDVAALIDPVHETVAIRRAQLLGVAGQHREAAELVEAWETNYTRIVDRAAPVGPRAALQQREAVSNHVS